MYGEKLTSVHAMEPEARSIDSPQPQDPDGMLSVCMSTGCSTDPWGIATSQLVRSYCFPSCSSQSGFIHEFVSVGIADFANTKSVGKVNF